MKQILDLVMFLLAIRLISGCSLDLNKLTDVEREPTLTQLQLR